MLFSALSIPLLCYTFAVFAAAAELRSTPWDPFPLGAAAAAAATAAAAWAAVGGPLGPGEERGGNAAEDVGIDASVVGGRAFELCSCGREKYPCQQSSSC